MDQIKNLFTALTRKQRISLGLAALAVIAGLVAFAKWHRENDFKLLFSGLQPEDAGAVLAKLREGNVEYRLGDNGTSVLAPSAKVAELRLQLASAGIPKSGRLGFELFDKTNFGASEFAEQINYHRAIEGELERSVMALAEVEQARVHVTFAKDSVFLESRQPAKASVLVKLRQGMHLSAQNVLAICHLTASAVENLAPETVSVLDMQGNLLSRPRRPLSSDSPEPSEATLEYSQHIERELLAKVNATLEPLVGSDKFRSSVSVDCDFSSGEQSEETFDPSKSVMVTSQKTEDVSGGASASGIPGSASSLPRPTSRPGAAGLGVTRRTENVTYQSSRVVKKLRLPQGQIKRVSVSVLVDQDMHWEGSGAAAKRVLEPPSAERLKTIRDLVAGAIGLSAERGDQLVIETLPFESTLRAGPMGATKPVESVPNTPGQPRLYDLLRDKFIPYGAAGALAAVVLLACMLLRRATRKAKIGVEQPPALAASPAAAPLSPAETQDPARLIGDVPNALKLPVLATRKTEILSRNIVDQAKKNPNSTAQVVRTWLSQVEQA